MIEFLKHHKEYCDAVADLIYDYWDHELPDYTRENSREWVRELADNESIPCIYVIKDQGLLAGMACLIRDGMEDRLNWDVIWLGTVFVYPQFRNRGIGSELVRFGQDLARRSGLESLYLYTPDKQGLYRRLGWVEYEETEYLNETVTIMKRSLVP